MRICLLFVGTSSMGLRSVVCRPSGYEVLLEVMRLGFRSPCYRWKSMAGTVITSLVLHLYYMCYLLQSLRLSVDLR